MAMQQDDTAAQLVAGHVKPRGTQARTDGQDSAVQPMARVPGGAQAVSHDAIAAEAHAIWTARGHADGNDVEDWLEAERRLRRSAGTHKEASRVR